MTRSCSSPTPAPTSPTNSSSLYFPLPHRGRGQGEGAGEWIEPSPLHGQLQPRLVSSLLRGGQVAQLVEHRTENPGVGGSIPSLPTILFNRLPASKFSLT